MLPKRRKALAGAGLQPYTHVVDGVATLVVPHLHLVDDETVLLPDGDYGLCHGKPSRRSDVVCREGTGREEPDRPDYYFSVLPTYGASTRKPREALKRHSAAANAGFKESLKSCAGIAWSEAVKAAERS